MFDVASVSRLTLRLYEDYKPFAQILPPDRARTLAIVTFMGISVRPAHAGYTVTLQQAGPNVVATGSGAFDLTGLTFITTGNGFNPGIDAGLGLIATGPFASSVDVYQGFTGPTDFGSGGSSANTASGDFVEISGVGLQLFVPLNYVSGAALSDSMTFNTATFASLGVIPGTYVWTWGTGADQNFTLKIGAAGVPDSGSTFSLLVVASGVLIGVRRLRPFHLA